MFRRPGLRPGQAGRSRCGGSRRPLAASLPASAPLGGGATHSWPKVDRHAGTTDRPGWVACRPSARPWRTGKLRRELTFFSESNGYQRARLEIQKFIREIKEARSRAAVIFNSSGNPARRRPTSKVRAARAAQGRLWNTAIKQCRSASERISRLSLKSLGECRLCLRAESSSGTNERELRKTCPLRERDSHVSVIQSRSGARWARRPRPPLLITDHRLKDADIVDHLVELVERKAAEIEAAKQNGAATALETAE